MPYDPSHKMRTRNKILESACRMFSANGFDATSIEDIMYECDLTRGGFYTHFRSKGQLYQEAMGHATQSLKLPAVAIEEKPDRWLDAILTSCLPPFDVSEQSASRWEFLAKDLGSQQPEVRAAYTRVFKLMSQRLCEEMVQASNNDRASLAAMAMTVGALAVAMTVDDASLKSSLINACREHAQTIFENSVKEDRLNFFWTAELTDFAHGSPAVRPMH